MTIVGWSFWAGCNGPYEGKNQIWCATMQKKNDRALSMEKVVLLQRAFVAKMPGCLHFSGVLGNPVVLTASQIK